MMRYFRIFRYLAILSVLSVTSVLRDAAAQSVSGIMSSGEYLYGEGRGYTLKEADEAALADLISKISVTVRSDFVGHEREVSNGDDVMSETEYRNVISTYSSATLANTQRIVIKDEPDAEVFRYVRKSEIDRIFRARADKVQEFVRNAEKALEKRQIDDALRYLYWGYSLVKSLRYPNEARFSCGGEDVMLVTWIPYRIGEILGDISLSAIRKSDTVYDLIAEYGGEPVRSMDYVFFDGADYSGIYSVLDGQGIIELRPGYAGEYVTVKVEYEFAGMAVSDQEVEAVLGAQKKSLFRKAGIRLRLPARNELKVGAISGPVVSLDNELAMTSDTERYVDRVLDVSRAVTGLVPESVRSSFTDGGWADFSRILSYGPVMINDDQSLECFRSAGDVVCRGLSCTFRFGSRTFNESLSFSFNNSGMISHVSLGIGKMAMNDILEKARWGEESRKRLISFLEDYRTAYAVKDIEYMERVFDDNAVIIVGNRLQRAVQTSDRTYVDNRYVKLTRYTKQEFIKRLRLSFASKEYINLHFSDLDIMKLRPDEERYGIQVRQDYYSSNYGDSGYLYLLVDLTSPELPVIHVRTWQEAPDPDFGIIGPGYF